MLAAYVDAVVDVLRVTAISMAFATVVLAATLIAVVAAAVGLVREAAVASKPVALRLRPATAHATGARIVDWN